MNTSVACVPDCAGKRCSSVSCAFWDSMPGTVKSSLNEPPAKTAPASSATSTAMTVSVAARGRRPTSAARRESEGGHERKNTQTQSKYQTEFEITTRYDLSMPGLRERKKAATRLAIRDAGMRLFDERGFGGTTVDDIAEAAGVSRATVFTYFPTKEEIVFGDAASAVEGLAARLREGDEPTVATVRAWLTELTGWLEPELLLQHRLRHEAPTVAARQLQLIGALEDVIAAALETELGPEQQLAARLTAASLMSGLTAIEERAAAQLSATRARASRPRRSISILDLTIAYVEAGIARTSAVQVVRLDQ